VRVQHCRPFWMRHLRALAPPVMCPKAGSHFAIGFGPLGPLQDQTAGSLSRAFRTGPRLWLPAQRFQELDAAFAALSAGSNATLAKRSAAWLFIQPSNNSMNTPQEWQVSTWRELPSRRVIRTSPIWDVQCAARPGFHRQGSTKPSKLRSHSGAIDCSASVFDCLAFSGIRASCRVCHYGLVAANCFVGDQGMRRNMCGERSLLSFLCQMRRRPGFSSRSRSLLSIAATALFPMCRFA
jgi:hypothetical protein